MGSRELEVVHGEAAWAIAAAGARHEMVAARATLIIATMNWCVGSRSAPPSVPSLAAVSAPSPLPAHSARPI